MAGLGRKVFTAGDVLTASDVQNYLMDQTVMNFAGTAARSSAIATPTTGMVTYRSDIDGLELYNGSSWLGVGAEQYITSASFSSTSSLEFTNVFSDTYKFYRFYFNWRGSTVTEVQMQFRENTTNKATQYYAGGNYGNRLGATGAYGTRDANVSFYVSAHATTGYSESVININRPSATQGVVNAVGFDNNNVFGFHFSGTNVDMTNFTGFRMFPTTGTINGFYTLTGIKV
jgi:hypothetical protein